MEQGKAKLSGVSYVGHHRQFTTDKPQVGYFPIGDRSRVWVVSVYGTESLEERGFIDNDISTSRRR